MAEDEAGLDPVVEFMASRGLSAGLLAEHVDDGTGHCAGCSWSARSRPVNPCVIRGYAEMAAEVERQRLPRRSADATRSESACARERARRRQTTQPTAEDPTLHTALDLPLPRRIVDLGLEPPPTR